MKLTFGSSLPDGVSAGSTTEATVNIRDDDTADLLVLPSSLDIDEGDSATFTVKLATQPTQSVAVAVASGDAGAATVSLASLSFSTTTWNDAQTVTVSGENDADGNNESLTVSLAASSGDAGYNSKTASVSVSITDDDTAGVTVHPTGLSVDEGGTATYTVVLDTEPTGEVRVTIHDPTDNTDVTAEPASLVFTTSNWDTAQTVTATAAQDDDAGDETATITHTVTGYGTVTTADDVTVAVADDAPDSLAVSFERDSYTVDEGSSVTVKVVLDADPERTVAIPITRTNQDGATDSDYSMAPGRVTFDSGETEQRITFTATDDDVDDDGESVRLGFGSSLPDGVSAGSTNEATVNITDDDDAIALSLTSVLVSFGGSAFAVAEGSSVEVTIKLSADPERTVVIPVTATGQDGATDSDYSVAPDRVTFNSGETEKTFYFTATQDTVQDDGESVRLTFGALPDGVATGSTDEATVSITDAAEVMEVSFEKSEYSVNEGHEVEVMVKLDSAPDHRIDIHLQKTNMNGTSDGDYYGIPSMLTFESGETEKRFTFFAEPDNESDDGETVVVSFEALPAMVQKGDPSESTVTLRDNGSPSQDGITCIDNNRASIVTLLSERGEISNSGKTDTWVITGVDPHRTYLVEILGADSNLDLWGQKVGGGSLTLADPHPVSLFYEDDEKGPSGTSEFNPGASDGGTSNNARFIFIFDKFGDYVLKVKSGDENGTGTYHLLVRYDNYCITRDDGSILFPYEGGPEGYAFDVRNDTGTNYRAYDEVSGPSYYASGSHVLGDNWGSMPDEDWIGLELKAGTEYEVHLEGDPDVPVDRRLTRPRIVGIYDEDEVKVHEGAAGSGTDPSVSLTFQTTRRGDYYLAVGSNPGDRTGLYSFRVEQTASDSAGQATANNSPTGGPGITGLPRVGEVLTATTSRIADADGVENASFSYQWVRHDPAANTDTDIPGATGSTYTVTREDRDRAIKVRVSFTDDGGNHETLTSFALLVLPPVNTPATGQPTISGRIEVGQTLTADTSGISDHDGLDNVAYSYQWIRNDGTSDTDITDATDSTHTLADADGGQTIKVRVSFTDDAGNDERLTSAATAEVSAGESTAEPPGRPSNLTGAANPDGTVTLRWDAPDDDSVTSYQILRRRPGEGEETLLVHVNDTGSTATEYTDNDVTPDVGHAYRVKAINAAGLSKQSNFVNVTPGQPAEPAQNNPATGTPGISGTVQVGETLTADTSGIADEDGLTNVSYSYQWIVSDGGADIDITSATDSSYTLVDADEGLAIKVRVSFTDDAGNEEAFTSAATATVATRPNTP